MKTHYEQGLAYFLEQLGELTPEEQAKATEAYSHTLFAAQAEYQDAKEAFLIELKKLWPFKYF